MAPQQLQEVLQVRAAAASFGASLCCGAAFCCWLSSCGAASSRCLQAHCPPPAGRHQRPRRAAVAGAAGAGAAGAHPWAEGVEKMCPVQPGPCTLPPLHRGGGTLHARCCPRSTCGRAARRLLQEQAPRWPAYALPLNHTLTTALRFCLRVCLRCAPQETDRRLREEQDAEYQRSLEADRQVRCACCACCGFIACCACCGLVFCCAPRFWRLACLPGQQQPLGPFVWTGACYNRGCIPASAC